jgi:hypothetical protein
MFCVLGLPYEPLTKAGNGRKTRGEVLGPGILRGRERQILTEAQGLLEFQLIQFVPGWRSSLMTLSGLDALFGALQTVALAITMRIGGRLSEISSRMKA